MFGQSEAGAYATHLVSEGFVSETRYVLFSLEQESKVAINVPIYTGLSGIFGLFRRGTFFQNLQQNVGGYGFIGRERFYLFICC